MHILLLSGGSGKRLWPLSNAVRSKQFIPLFPTPEGGRESMVQRVQRQIREAVPEAGITVATGKEQVPTLRRQLGEAVSLCIEPCRRDTFPAMAMAAAYLQEKEKLQPDEVVIVCPIDPWVETSFFEKLQMLSKAIEREEANLALLGITPTYPSEKYGYILPEGRTPVDAQSKTEKQAYRVERFVEKPDAQEAEALIAQGALWNAGIFAFHLEYLLKKAHENLSFTDYADLYAHYAEQPAISFDYAVAEKETERCVLRYEGEWKDLGTWNTLTEALDEATIGEGVQGESCKNTHIINELDIPVLAMGLSDVVISASPQGILVSDKEQSSYLKPYVEKLDAPIRFAEKSWGSYEVLDVDQESLTIKVTLLPGHAMHYHNHQERDEVWVVVSGEGRTTIDGMEQPIRTGDVVTMAAGCKHTVRAETALKLIEVQLGNDIRAEDKEIFPAT